MTLDNSTAIQLIIDGHVAQPVVLTYAQLSRFDDESRIDDIHSLDAIRRGAAIKLRGLLARADEGLATGLAPSADHIAIHSQDGYRVEVPLKLVIDRAVVLYSIDGHPLADELGGPLRFLVPNAAACKTAEIDTCGNVKGLVRLELVRQGGDSV